MKFLILLFFLVNIFTNHVYCDQTTDVGSSLFCTDLHPQTSLNMEQVSDLRGFCFVLFFL